MRRRGQNWRPKARPDQRFRWPRVCLQSSAFSRMNFSSLNYLLTSSSSLYVPIYLTLREHDCLQLQRRLMIRTRGPYAPFSKARSLPFPRLISMRRHSVLHCLDSMCESELEFLASFVLGCVQIFQLLLFSYVNNLQYGRCKQHRCTHLLGILVPDLLTLLVTPYVVNLRKGVQEDVEYSNTDQNTIAAPIYKIGEPMGDRENRNTYTLAYRLPYRCLMR